MFGFLRPSSRHPDTVAAVDLGSNSFHLIVAQVNDNDLQVVDRLKEMVRLGEGLDADKNLTPEVEARALACLTRFGQRLKSLPLGSVRVVGTNTLRQVRNSAAFLHGAEVALGHPVDIIAGREEARLVYLGVAHSLATDERKLVVDIGGGSTELIVGKGFTAESMDSLHMGCVSISRKYFPQGEITLSAMRSAELAGALEIRPVKLEYRRAGWQQAIGSSGTIRAIQSVVQANDWVDEGEGITADSLQKLRDALIGFGHIDRIELEGLSEERRPVFSGGVAVLRSVFKALNIEQMQVSDKALREGLLYDMLGRTGHQNVRKQSILALCKRYDIEMNHAGRVEQTALNLLSQVTDQWNLEESDYSPLLSWASRLHELGLTVSHSQYHKHGAYLIANSDMAGFSRQDQCALAALVRGHRRKFPLDVFEAQPIRIRNDLVMLCILLRLAVLLNRDRNDTTAIDILVRAKPDQLKLVFTDGWLEKQPLYLMELKQESKRLKAAGFKLKFK
ncbi:MAG: exopolyphosphatase [Gammaproteobacteria bacterium]|nr:exopolyphosphatase [Gammaproteobacteria bacterium]